MKASLLALLLNVLAMNALAQNPYQLAGTREAVLAGSGVAGIGVSYLLRPHTTAFTPEQIAALDISRIPRFDRFATRHYSAAARKGSDILFWTASAIPLLLLTEPAVRRDASTVGVVAGEVFLVNTALTLLTKELAHRPRPFLYNSAAPLSDKLKRDARMSFFSGHTSTSAAMCFATAKIWTDYHPDSQWEPAVWTAAVGIPAVVGYLRMKGGKHFLSDVLVGFAVGAATGLLVPQLHRR